LPLPADIAVHPAMREFAACAERPATLGRLIDEVTSRHAGRQAIAYAGESILYRELRARIRLVAKALVANGVSKGMRVAVLMANRPEFVVAVYAVAMVGGVIVPVHSIATARERHYMLAHSDAGLLLIQPDFERQHYLDELIAAHPGIRDALPGQIGVPALPALRRVVSLDAHSSITGVQAWPAFVAAGSSIADELLDAIAAQVDPSDDALIIYTSGSTGEPKGVVHRHRAVALQQWRARIFYTIAEDERVWSVYPLFWSAGFIYFLGVLTAGACMVMQEKMEPEATLRLLEAERVTMLASSNSTIAPLADHPDVVRRDLSSIRHLPTGVALRRHLRVAEQRWGPMLSWGQTETCTIATYAIPGPDQDEPAVPGGYPLPGTVVRIVDPQTGAELPAGETGEIALKGQQIMRGYHKRPPEAGFDANGFLRSGDSGYLDASGRLHFTGRLVNMIKTRGANVSPLEVEGALSRWGRVRNAYVVGIPDALAGEAVVACVVPHDADAVSEVEVLDWLRGELASYKVPRRVVFLTQDEIPLTPSNKVQLAKLREIASARVSAWPSTSTVD
jgi:acyl-CoA synthetase (AMP-forming)/AMP-acid ligase II